MHQQFLFKSKWSLTFDGVFFNLAEARAAASEVSVGSEPRGFMLSLGRVAIPVIAELFGGGGGGGGGTLD